MRIKENIVRCFENLAPVYNTDQQSKQEMQKPDPICLERSAKSNFEVFGTLIQKTPALVILDCTITSSSTSATQNYQEIQTKKEIIEYNRKTQHKYMATTPNF